MSDKADKLIAAGLKKPATQTKEESKADKFKRLRVKRVPRCLKVIGHVANLFNRASYAWTPEQAKQVLEMLRDALKDVEHRANGTAQSVQEVKWL